MAWKKGQSGNPAGRKRNEARELLEKAVHAEAKKRKKSLFEHAIERAYEDDTVLVALLRKLIPDLKGIDANLFIREPFRLILSNGNGSSKPSDPGRDNGTADSV